MTKSFSELRNLSSNVSEIAKKLKETEGKKDYNDNRFWQATLDKAKNGSAEIRFLPSPPGEDMPFVKVYSHNFKGDGGWFIHNCPTTIGLPCPVCEDNGEHWKTGPEGENFVRQRKSKRKTSYIANILVIKDPECPENDGKVFLFKYGPKIQEKIMNAISPKFADETPYIPYDIDTGANFKLRICEKDGFANFDNSTFSAQSQIKGTDKELEEIWRSEYSLNEFVDKEKAFKSYDDLKKLLDKTLKNKNVQEKTIEESLNAMSAGKTVAPKVAPAIEYEEPEELETMDIEVSDEMESLKELFK